MTFAMFRPGPGDAGPPWLARPVSQACTRSQLDEETHRYWCGQIGERPRLHRKQWEFCYIAQVLATAGKLAPGQRGIGFGVGEEPLAALFAARGAHVLATDLAPDAAAGTGWIETSQHARGRDGLNRRGICPPDLFDRNVEFRFADMNALPDDVLADGAGTFDFVWSACALEHLGSIARGEAFVRNTARLLAPGGVAVHTTEFNCYSNSATLDEASTVLFRRRDFERLGTQLAAMGCTTQFNFELGGMPADEHIDVAPYSHELHLKLRLDEWVTTSFGLVFTRKPA